MDIFSSQPEALYFLIGALQRAKGFNFDEFQVLIFLYGIYAHSAPSKQEIIAYHKTDDSFQIKFVYGGG